MPATSGAGGSGTIQVIVGSNLAEDDLLQMAIHEFGHLMWEFHGQQAQGRLVYDSLNELFADVVALFIFDEISGMVDSDSLLRDFSRSFSRHELANGAYDSGPHTVFAPVRVLIGDVYRATGGSADGIHRIFEVLQSFAAQETTPVSYGDAHAVSALNDRLGSALRQAFPTETAGGSEEEDGGHTATGEGGPLEVPSTAPDASGACAQYERSGSAYGLKRCQESKVGSYCTVANMSSPHWQWVFTDNDMLRHFPGLYCQSIPSVMALE